MKDVIVHFAARQWQFDAERGMHWRGTAFHQGCMCNSAAQLAQLIPERHAKPEYWRRLLKRLNGFHAMVWVQEDRIIAAVDHVRSIPLFYAESDGKLYLSDDAEWVRQAVGDCVMDTVAQEEFRLAGYVTGPDTLYPNVKQLQAGEFLHVSRGPGMEQLQASTHRYYRFLHPKAAACTEEEQSRRMNGIATAAIDRLIQYAGGRQIVIPLSGGYDSRFIALMLANRKYPKVLTFTYGIKGNKESGYSRRVAEELGLPWHFVEYSEQEWCAAWHTDERRQFQRWAANWSSLPHVQDWIAVRALKQGGIADPDCVFVPGHSGDFVAGSHIPPDAFSREPVDTELLVRRIIERHYVVSASEMSGDRKIQVWRERILDRAEIKNIADHEQFADAFEKWDWQERQAKYIVNAVRVYEFFGFDWWLPLWDVAFMAFWQDAPLALRQGRRWYLEQVRSAYAAATQREIGQALHNSSDIGPFGRLARAMLKQFPVEAKHHLKALRHVFVPKRVTNSYLTSHLPNDKVIRLQRSGYSPIGMLVDEFLELEREMPGKHRGARETQ